MNPTITFRRAFILAIANLSLLVTYGQTTPDTLFLHSGRQLVVHVIELGLDDIKYHLPGDDLRVSIERSEVALLKMADGRQFRTQAPELNAELSHAALRRTQAIKFHFLSPAFNHITFGYERMIKPWTNLELTAGYIGAGFNTDRPQTSGLLFRAGIKFISRPDMIVRGMRMSHPLHGRYVKPEVAFNSFAETPGASEYSYSDRPSTMRYSNATLSLVIGKQRFLGEGALLDTWVGIGYGLRIDEPYQGPFSSSTHQYTHIYLGQNSPLILSAGLSLGIAFNGQRKRVQE